MTDKIPWWWPERVDAKWRFRVRADYPDTASSMSDEELDEYYAEGWRYMDTWDHLGDAREGYERLADAFLDLVAKAGKTPRDFK